MSNKLGSEFWKSLLWNCQTTEQRKIPLWYNSLLLLIVEIQNGKRRKIPLLKNLKHLSYDGYLCLDGNDNKVHYRKVGA